MLKLTQVYTFAFVLMNKNTRELYDAVLDKILTVYEERYPNVFSTWRILCQILKTPYSLPVNKPLWDVHASAVGFIMGR
jgi:hypothetical protein